LSENLVVLFTLENRRSKKQVMEDDSSREDVTDGIALGIHVPDVDDLRSNEPRGSTPHEEILLLLSISRQAEVTDRQVPRVFLSKHDVLRLQITMDDPVPREVAQTSQDVLDDGLCLVMLNFSSTLNRRKNTFKSSLSCMP
jgi:hypothetical protein